MSDFSVVVGVTWAALAGFGLDLFSFSYYKLDSIYGNAANRVDILKELYGAEQRNDEDVISWSCRLEDIMGRARDMGAILCGYLYEPLVCCLSRS
jgi:hypothetical protein